MNQIPKTLPVLSHVLFPEKCVVLYLSTRYWSKCEVLISPQTHSIISVKIICAKSMRCKVLGVMRKIILSLTAKHCEIARSQGLQQPKQLGTRKQMYIVLEHDTEKLHVVNQLVIKIYYFFLLMVKIRLG